MRLFSPWRLDISPRMRTHLEAAGHSLPDDSDSTCPTGKELVERVLEPVATLPEVAPHLRTGVRVLAVSREGLLKHEEIGTAERGERPFRLLLADRDGKEWSESADAVLDCTGTWGNPNPTGDGGISAPGERELEGDIRRDIPNVDFESDLWVGRTILLVGAGHSAQTAAVSLARLAESHPGTRVIWALRREQPVWPVDPEDPLPERARLTREAQALASGGSSAIQVIPGVVVDSLERRDGRIEVTLRESDGVRRTVTVDRVLSLTGSVGDHQIYRQLQVHECYATSGPMKLAAALLGSSSTDCLDQESQGAETLVNPEPGFFILGSKSYGRNNTFLMRVGWQQVDEVFSLLG